MFETFNYKKWIALSISAHICALLLFIMGNKIGFLMRHPVVISGNGVAGSINVDVVGLPNILKKDLNTQMVSEEEEKKEMVLPKTSVKESKKNALQKIKEALSQESSYLKKLKIIKGLKTNIGGVQAGAGSGSGTRAAGPGDSDRAGTSAARC